MKQLIHFLKNLVPQGMKNYYHLAQAVIACILFGFPARRFTVIGVTGTNGKTTTVQMIARILEKAGKKVAFASTINFHIGEREWVNASKFTTLSPWRLQKFLRKAADEGCEYAVVETSSHALDQNRVWGISYAIAVLTNVTREHLDYHKTMEEYRKAKCKLFENAKRSVVNLDMEQPEYFCNLSGKQALTYSTKNEQAHIYAQDTELDFKGTQFTVDDVRFELPLPGLFNIENALAALGVARLLKIDFAVAKEAFAEVPGVPGRMELVPNEVGADILIDYAVTPDAFEKLYASILPLKIPGTKIIHVFGACGERDRGKRPILGEIASGYADVVILTNEDPYYENPERIIDEIEKGLPESLRKRSASMRAGVTRTGSKEYYRIFDRREAIRKALSIAEHGDIVLLTGKGAEETIAIKDKRLPWSERKVVEEELGNLAVEETLQRPS